MKLSKAIYILAFCSLLLTLAGCRPEGILHSWEMRAVFIDLHKTDALLQTKGLNGSPTEVKAIYYAQVLEAHGITQAEFDSSLVWYTAHPQLFDKIYPKVVAELEKEQDEFLELHPELSVVERGKEAGAGEQDALRPFTHKNLDSVLWVIQEGYPHSWHPSVHDFVDEFFPQIGVTGGGVVDSLQTSVDIAEIAHD